MVVRGSKVEGGVGVYEVVVKERRGSRTWAFTKRYSDFHNLHTLLLSAGYEVSQIKSSLPPKRWFGNLSGDIISFRQRALERYLWLCLQYADPDDCSAVRDFLETTTTVGPGGGLERKRTLSGGGASYGGSDEYDVGSNFINIKGNMDSKSNHDSDNEFQPRSLNEEERSLSNMLGLSNMQDDGAPTPMKDDGEGDSEYVTIKQSSLDEMMEEQKRLYAEIDRLKEENKNLFNDLSTAEDRNDELEDRNEELNELVNSMKGGEREV